jgi:hypothetical protein
VSKKGAKQKTRSRVGNWPEADGPLFGITPRKAVSAHRRASVRFRPVADIRGRCQSDAIATIYIPLLNEGVDVWRPVKATKLTTDTYRIEGPIPDDEKWAFAPGSVVY